MLKRIHIQGYKSLENVEVSLSQLVVLFGPNAAGKSNLLDVLQLLSKLGTSRTVKEAFDPPYRGKPLESFTIGRKGIKGLLQQERLSFSIEAASHILRPLPGPQHSFHAALSAPLSPLGGGSA